ncbi:hypothetical protein [Streptomyces chartreusis]|uniref:hypothetical protein n=1 Tax=Streptomyces chartreusis TaxID=1969 RepID=UPI003819B07A
MSMVLTDAEGRVLFCSPVRPGSCADITRTGNSDWSSLLADGPVMEILADAGYQGMGAQTGGRVGDTIGWREHMSDIVQAVAGLLSHTSRPPPSPAAVEREHRQHRRPRRATANRARPR